MSAHGLGWGVSAFGMTATDRTAMARDWLTLDEAAELIGRSASVLRRQAASGALKAVKTGPRRVWRVHRRDLEAYRLRTQVEDSTARLLLHGKEWPETKPERLTDREWHVLTEHVRHGRTLADIAAELNVTRGSVWQSLDAAVRKYVNDPWE